MVKKNSFIWIVPILLMSGCGDSGPDYTPFGDGMKAIGICLVVCAVVHALAELVQSGNKPNDDGSTRKRRRPDHEKGGKS